MHVIVTSGTCATNGYEVIEDTATCEYAAGQVGWSDTAAETRAIGSSYPRGCQDWSSSNGGELLFNTNTDSAGSCGGGGSKACLCAFTGPACVHGDGATANDANCVCGTSGACTAATGLFCDTANNDRCSVVPTCVNTNGTVDNGVNCACGSADCDAATTGLFCYSQQSACADYAHPRKLYPIVTSGTCATKGYGRVEDAATCGAAAGQVGWNDTTAHTENGEWLPLGCWDHISSTSGGGLVFNTATNSTESCGKPGHSYACLCAFTGPACAHGDGATANLAPCVCGTSEPCTSTTGLFCDAAKNQCDDVPYCANTNGTAANPANCRCGTVDCDAATTGLFCTSSSSSCSPFPTCTTTNGTAANLGDCVCGTTDCDAATTGLFCTSSLSSCSPFPTCTTADGTAANPANCACGTTDCDGSTGLFCDAAENRCRFDTCGITDGPTPHKCACTHHPHQIQIILRDSFGDGWNGNTIFLNGDRITLTGGRLGYYNLNMSDGLTDITLTGMATGSYPTEVSWEIVAPSDRTFGPYSMANNVGDILANATDLWGLSTCAVDQYCTVALGCTGCDGEPNSGKVHDACGVCGGNNSTCADDCGVPDGDNSTCAGCDGEPNSGKVDDACGACDGPGIPDGACDCAGNVLDDCGVCGGNNSTCADDCGVPDGDNSTCAGCDGEPNSGKVDDACGVCGGNGIPAGYGLTSENTCVLTMDGATPQQLKDAYNSRNTCN
jgi:hypothetical protein